MKPSTMEETQAHVLIFPFPIQGHMPPMLKLAHLLLAADDHIFVTFVNTDHTHQRFSRHSPAALQRLSRHPRFRFRTVPDGLPDDDPRQSLQFMRLEESLRTRSREAYRELLVPGRECDPWPPINCVVADAVLPVATEVAEEVGIPVMVFRTSSACCFWVFHCTRELVNRGELPFPSKKDADLDEMVQAVEGMEGLLRRRDLPGFCRDVETSDGPILRLVAMAVDNASRGRALIMNTFQALEAPMLSLLRKDICPTVYTIGPLNVLAGNSISTVNLFDEDRRCIRWLDSQPPKSVVYVSFGSVIVMSVKELVELWHGLVSSNQRFLWAMREDIMQAARLAAGHEMAAVPERGCVVGWAPQEEVLAHPAVGCFLTHSGWNSTMESIAAGVPMICLPFITDQQVNSRFVGEVWKIGVDLKDKCERSAVERAVREVMEGATAEEMRRSVGVMAEAARASVEEGGSSRLSFRQLVEHIKALKSPFPTAIMHADCSMK